VADSVRLVLLLSGLAVLVAGPPLLFLARLIYIRAAPSALSFVLASTAICTVLYWAVFVLSDQLLEKQFLDLTGGGNWTPEDEALWSEAEHQVVAAYFGDGGRNVFALLIPAVFAAYSALLVVAAGLVQWIFFWPRGPSGDADEQGDAADR